MVAGGWWEEGEVSVARAIEDSTVLPCGSSAACRSRSWQSAQGGLEAAEAMADGGAIVGGGGGLVG